MHYQETGSSVFPISTFPWRKIAVAGLPGWRGASPASSAAVVAKKGFAGGFHYTSSALVSSSLCRNRFILWQCRGSSVYLLEVSLDCSLAHAALHVEVCDGSTILPNVTVQELESSSIAVLFATSSCVFRLLLPHPDTISKNPVLSSAGGGLQPSVFTSAKATSLQGSNMAALFSQHSSAQPVTCASGCISPAGDTTFTLASPSGSIHLIHLPSPHQHGLPVRTELKQFSVISRVWASVVPAAFRGGRPAEDAPVSLFMHSFGGNLVVLALCQDVHLRLWATEPADCIMTCDLVEYLLNDTEADASLSANNLCLRKATGATATSLRFAVYIETLGRAQVSVFQLFMVDRQLHLEHIHSSPCKDGGDLVDMYCTNTAVWTVWRVRDGDSEDSCVLHFTYDGEFCHGWQKAWLSSPPPRDVSLLHTTEPRSVYLEALLHPGRFATSAINRALELYGSISVNATVQQLKEEATAAVEHELRASADSTQLEHEQFRELQVKCWSKFYGCCHQYWQLMSQLVGVFEDPTTGLVCLFKEDMLSFMYPASSADCLTQMTTNDVQSDIHLFMEAARITRHQLNSEAIESLMNSGEPATLAAEMAEAIADLPPKECVLSKVTEILSGIASVPQVLEDIASILDPTPKEITMETVGEDMPDTELQLMTSQLFTSTLCERLLASCVRDTCLSRMTVAQDVLLLICLLQHIEEAQNVEQSLVDRFSSFLLNYRCVYWLSCQSTMPASPSSMESYLRQLAGLNISNIPRQTPVNSECSVLELYVHGVGGQDLRATLLKMEALPNEASLFPMWSNLLPLSVSILISQLWPSVNSVAVCQFLLSSCQCTHLQDYVVETAGVVNGDNYSRHFLLAQSLLTTGEIDKATDHFLIAADGLGDPPEALIEQVARSSEDREDGEGEEKEQWKLRYYLRVMGLFERVSCPLAVLRIAVTAVRHVDKDDPISVVLWSMLFKNHLELGHYEEAYEAMMANPDPIRKKECLRHFVVILTEQKQLKLLCHLTYPGLEEDIENVIEDRARSVDLIKHKYYDLLYCFHTTRQNYRKAATVMYEYGLRLGREAPGTKSLKKQANCYCMCLTALHLAEPQYAWIVVPVELGEILAKNAKTAQNRKRAHPSHEAQVQVEVRTIADIEKDYSLVRTKLSLVRREPTMATLIHSPFVSPEEVVARLVQVGLFDKAVDTALCFELPLDSIFEALASRCVHLSTNMMAFRDGVEDVSTWNWPDANESLDIPTPTERSVVDKAWLMLKSNLETHDPLHNYNLQKCVARKLLSLGAHLPQWLVKTYKETKPAELLQIYLAFDLLEEATHLALDYIKAILGPRKDEFALQTTLHASSPSVWLPYSSLDHLQLSLQRVQTVTPLAELSSQLSSQLEEYFETTTNVTADMEHHAQQKMMATY